MHITFSIKKSSCKIMMKLTIGIKFITSTLVVAFQLYVLYKILIFLCVQSLEQNVSAATRSIAQKLHLKSSFEISAQMLEKQNSIFLPFSINWLLCLLCNLIVEIESKLYTPYSYKALENEKTRDKIIGQETNKILCFKVKSRVVNLYWWCIHPG